MAARSILFNSLRVASAPSMRAPAFSRAMSGRGDSLWEAVKKHSGSKATAIVCPHQDDGTLSYKGACPPPALSSCGALHFLASRLTLCREVYSC